MGGGVGCYQKGQSHLLIYSDNKKAEISTNGFPSLLQTPLQEPVCYMTCFISIVCKGVFSVAQLKS